MSQDTNNLQNKPKTENNDSFVDPSEIDKAALKQKKLWLFAGIAIAVVLLLVILWLIFSLRQAKQDAADSKQKEVSAQTELANANEILKDYFEDYETQFGDINAQYIQINKDNPNKVDYIIQNDSIIDKYMATKAEVEKLLAELKNERTINEAQVKKLKAEVETLRTILREYTQKINDLTYENGELKASLATTQKDLEEAQKIVNENSATIRQQNVQIERAKKLTLTGVELKPLNNKNKYEKHVKKAKNLLISFNISPNNTTDPGEKHIYARITSPEGDLLGNVGTFNYGGSSVGFTTDKTVEYAGIEIGGVEMYWPVTSTLNPGDYVVELFCDGDIIESKHFSLN